MNKNKRFLAWVLGGLLVSFIVIGILDVTFSPKPTVKELDELMSSISREFTILQINNDPDIAKKINDTWKYYVRQEYGLLWKLKVPKEYYVRTI